MINHLRTLLLNAAGTTSPGSQYPGEEFVVPTYQPVTLSTNLAALRGVLFGPGADRAMQNYRLREVFSIIHSTELAPYATAIDSRITYWPARNSELFRSLAFGATATQTSGTALSFSIQSPQGVPSALGQIYQQYKVAILNGTQVKVSRLVPPYDSQTYNYTITGGLSNAIPLIDPQLTARFGDPGAGTPSWTVALLAQPQYPITAVLPALQAAGADSLFTSGQPFTGLRALWELQTLPAIYRVGAAVLALAYQIEILRQAQAP